MKIAGCAQSDLQFFSRAKAEDPGERKARRNRAGYMPRAGEMWVKSLFCLLISPSI